MENALIIPLPDRLGNYLGRGRPASNQMRILHHSRKFIVPKLFVNHDRIPNLFVVACTARVSLR